MKIKRNILKYPKDTQFICPDPKSALTAPEDSSGSCVLCYLHLTAIDIELFSVNTYFMLSIGVSLHANSTSCHLIIRTRVISVKTNISQA